MGIFLLLATVTLYLYPSTDSYGKVNIVVKVLGYLSFVLFCTIVAYHVYHIKKHTHWNIYLSDLFWKKINKHREQLKFLPAQSGSNSEFYQHGEHNYRKLETFSQKEPFQESLLEQM